ncbi:A/G-specific adenine glycosylase [Sulfidibacter corallicola]|uniref:Adenine DNA glycosylase n=1 Tax=Sulfidibacter corallicola TaxID=2818388 RepID=A0A8A4TRB2_SULCO|nr:A/G-specific adenine glycosylase [Sulfidibacter corallicola]QTD52090.1 A/G-specific adenine glycosylase [Sulfidibacter corallicola]
MPPEEHSFGSQLTAWYRRFQRKLPWRETRDPYAILVSELMLQQTQVKTVIPYFRRFLVAFPDPAALAAAEEASVLKLWQGLGYYRRARYLQKAAKAIVADHGGRFPSTKAEIDALPGVGPYTSAAVASIAFGLPFACVDGNVIRVISRIAAIDEDVGRAAVKKRIQETAQALLSGHEPGDFNQAVMELGATICTPRSPSCLACPVSDHCSVVQRGLMAEAFPVKTKRVQPSKVDFESLFVFVAGESPLFLMGRRPDSGLMASMWELPTRVRDEGRPWPEWFHGELQYLGRLEEPVVHRFTHLHATYRLSLFQAAHPFDWRIAPDGYADTRWVSADDLAQIPVTKVFQKAMPKIQAFLNRKEQPCPSETSTLPGV